MPRWLKFVFAVVLVCIVALVGGGYFAMRWAQGEFSGSLETSIAETTEASVLEAILIQGLTGVDLSISQYELDINTAKGPSGESGFSVTTFGSEDEVVIFGARTTIDASGIKVELADMTFRAVPLAEAGRIVLTQPSFDGGLTGWVFSGAAIENGLERGINNALSATGLKPVGVSLGVGFMKITTEPA